MIKYKDVMNMPKKKDHPKEQAKQHQKMAVKAMDKSPKTSHKSK